MSTSRVLKATSAYNWRSKTVTMTMEVMRRMRNTTRQATMKMRLDIMKTFVRKLRRSGYSSSTVTGMVESGLRFYYRKVRIELEGGPPVNSRDDTNDVGKKRAKLGASLRWFNRRRGGQEEKSLKENGWRQESRNRSGRKVQISREGPRRTVDKVDVSQEEGAQSGRPQEEEDGKLERPVEATLLVPYTPDSALKEAMQKSDDEYCKVVRSRRIRIMENGGNKLINVLGRNDPWANRRVCEDEACPTCQTRTWLQEERKAAKREKQEMPPLLIQQTSHNCRREGLNYTLQCIPCVNLGRKTLYRGESSRSARQHHKEHSSDIELGLVTSPVVEHCILEHGGQKPHVTFLLDRVEGRPLYSLVRESVLISNMPAGPERMNRCMEWGAPRVPVLSVAGGDGPQQHPGEHNPRAEWTRNTMRQIDTGAIKRIRYWSQEDTHLDHEQPEPKPKRMRIENIQGLDTIPGVRNFNPTTTQSTQESPLQTSLQQPQSPQPPPSIPPSPPQLPRTPPTIPKTPPPQPPNTTVTGPTGTTATTAVLATAEIAIFQQTGPGTAKRAVVLSGPNPQSSPQQQPPPPPPTLPTGPTTPTATTAVLATSRIEIFYQARPGTAKEAVVVMGPHSPPPPPPPPPPPQPIPPVSTQLPPPHVQLPPHSQHSPHEITETCYTQPPPPLGGLKSKYRVQTEVLN